MMSAMGWGRTTILALLTVVSMFVMERAVYAEDAAADAKAKVRYRGSKEINFEKLLIEGELKRKQITVVTGNSADGTDGLLRLRENFLDRVAMDAGEEVP